MYELTVAGESFELVSWSDQAFASVFTPAAEVARGTERADFQLHDSRDTHHLVQALNRLGVDSPRGEELAHDLVADILERRPQLPPIFPRLRRLFARH